MVAREEGGKPGENVSLGTKTKEHLNEEVVNSAMLLIDPVRNFNEKLDLANMEPSVTLIRAVLVGKKKKGRNQIPVSEGGHEGGHERVVVRHKDDGDGCFGMRKT